MSLTNKGDVYHPIFGDDMKTQLMLAKEHGANRGVVKAQDPLSLHELDRIDYIDLTGFEEEEKHDMIREFADNMWQDYSTDRDISDEYFFRDLVIKEHVDDGSKDIRYWNFHIDKKKYLIIDSYTFSFRKGRMMLNYDIGFHMLFVNYYFVWVIFTRLIEEYMDDRRAFAKESFDLLADLGVKIRFNDKNNIYYYLDEEDYGYNNYNQRLFYPANEFGRNLRRDLKKYVVDVFASGMGRYGGINNYLLRSVETDEVIDVQDGYGDYQEEMYIQEYIEEPIEDKHVILSIGELPTSISGTNNIRKFKHRIKRVYQYKFQVRGHKHHYWVGSGPNKHLEERWVDSYYKNKDKPFKIIKEIQDES